MIRSDRWQHVRDIARQGAQGHSYQGRDRMNGSPVFIKVLKQSRAVARKRFRREVAAYETVQSAGLPHLIYENGKDWNDRQIELFMVLEWIDGTTLRDRVARQGPLSLDDAAACVKELGLVLRKCHEVGVAHRDVKPDNVMLRDGNVRRPVLVDFGLSFNEADNEDVTRVEEIGNRFLRLPEHAAEGHSRSPLSDVTQLAGLLLYCLTGFEPRILSDEQGRAPHQRDHVREALASAADGGRLRRLQTLFDRAFDTRLLVRYQSVDEFSTDVEKAEQSLDVDDVNVMAQFQELVEAPSNQEGAERRRALGVFTAKVHAVVNLLADGSGLVADQTGHQIGHYAGRWFGETQMRMWANDIDPNDPLLPRVTFRFEFRGPDVVLSADGDDIWRGHELDADLVSSIERAIIAAFVKMVQHASDEDYPV